MACKYKIIKEDFFGGTPYCSLHDDFCINLRFACDTNCQIYEDQKELEKIKELFNHTCKCKHLVLDECSLTGKNCIGINECLYKHQQILQEVKGCAQDLHYSMLHFHTGFTHKIADRVDYYLDQMKQKFDEVQK